MKKLLETIRKGQNLLQIAGVTVAVFFLLAGPCWTLYAYLLDLGPGGPGGEAAADTPAAASIAEMRQTERFTVRIRGSSENYAEIPVVFVDGDTYWLITLDSGETVAARFWPESIRWERQEGRYLTICPVGTWKEWSLSEASLAQLKADAPQLSVTDHYADMMGNHRDGRTREKFIAGFRTFSLVIGLAVMLAAGLLQGKKKEREADASLPRNDLERWIVGTYAIWGQFFAQLGHRKDGQREVKARRGPIRIGGQPMDTHGQAYTREVLKESWEIEDRQELMETVEYMSAGPGFTKCDTQAARAWQLCRSMQLLGMGFVAGWYSREEMLRRSCPVGRKMQENFRSWEELCEGFLEGFYTWRAGAFGVRDARAALQERREIYRELQARPDSPYRLSWYLTLDPERWQGGETRKPAWEK